VFSQGRVLSVLWFPYLCICMLQLHGAGCFHFVGILLRLGPVTPMLNESTRSLLNSQEISTLKTKCAHESNTLPRAPRPRPDSVTVPHIQPHQPTSKPSLTLTVLRDSDLNLAKYTFCTCLRLKPKGANSVVKRPIQGCVRKARILRFATK
jgi:hypothetical protein